MRTFSDGEVQELSSPKERASRRAILKLATSRADGAIYLVRFCDCACLLPSSQILLHDCSDGARMHPRHCHPSWMAVPVRKRAICRARSGLSELVFSIFVCHLEVALRFWSDDSSQFASCSQGHRQRGEPAAVSELIATAEEVFGGPDL